MYVLDCYKVNQSCVSTSTAHVHVVLPLMAMMQEADLDFSRPLNGLTRTATFTEDISSRCLRALTT